MDLKDFIKETVSAIVEATQELQEEFEAIGVIINPPVSNLERDLYEHEQPEHRYRRVASVQFDVAVTAATETAGGAKAGLRVFSIEAGGEGKHTRNHEEVSRVKFAIPIVLSSATVEKVNKVKAQLEIQRQNEAYNSAVRNRGSYP
jgi:hypothetical protein